MDIQSLRSICVISILQCPECFIHCEVITDNEDTMEEARFCPHCGFEINEKDEIDEDDIDDFDY